MKNKSNQEREAIAKSKKDLADEMKDDFWTKGEKNQNFLSKINKVVNDINNADDDGTAHKDTISSMLAAQLLDLRVFRKYNELQERYNKKDKSLDLIETEKFFKEYPNVEEALDEPFVQDELNNLISGKIDNFDLFNQWQDAIILDDYNKNKLYEGVTINLLLKEANIPATNVIGQKGQKWISSNVQSKNGLEFAVINISSNHWVLAFKEKNKIHVIDPMGKII